MILPVDPEIYQNDELKHWGILGMKWGIRHFKNEFTHSEEFLSHYRTPGSKNGVRLYQYPDGTLTELGKLHYYGNNLMGKTPKSARGQYYDPKHKPGTFDFYGKEQKQNLKEFVQNNGGQKRYKGYERSEMHDIHEPAYDWNYKNHRKELRKNVERYNEFEKQWAMDHPQKYVDQTLSAQPANFVISQQNVDNGKNFLLEFADSGFDPVNMIIKRIFK